jgi:hypothetical protein
MPLKDEHDIPEAVAKNLVSLRSDIHYFDDLQMRVRSASDLAGQKVYPARNLRGTLRKTAECYLKKGKSGSHDAQVLSHFPDLEATLSEMSVLVRYFLKAASRTDVGEISPAYRALRQLAPLYPTPGMIMGLADDDFGKSSKLMAKYLTSLKSDLTGLVETLQEKQASAEPEIGTQNTASAQDEFDSYTKTLITEAGGGLTLTAAAEKLGMSRQALHKRVKEGSVLGMMLGSKITIPSFQFFRRNGKDGLTPGMEDVVQVFDLAHASRWDCLQFLLETDPNLDMLPIDALQKGHPAGVAGIVRAAQAYLGIGEGDAINAGQVVT